MNYRAIANYASRVLKTEAIFMLVPLLISLYEREFNIVYGFLITIAIIVAVAIWLDFVKRGNQHLNAKDGFALVAICWILISVFGSLPFMFSGEFSSYIDCLFESISGFTTTGATVLTNVETLNKGLLFWRVFTQWIGGMGILVFLLAVVQTVSSDHNLIVLKAETPGPTPGKILPNLRQNAKLLYGIYCCLTLSQIVLYYMGGMPLFDSVCHAFGTAGTGGFSIWNNSIGHYDSVYIEVVTTVFMILFGVNFNIYYFVIVRKIKSAVKSEELRAYIGIIVVSIAIITLNLFGSAYDSFLGALRHSSFSVAAVMTTTCYVTADFNHWPELSKMILLILMFIGACAGSTGGGLKVSRILIGLKEAKRILFRISHPRSFDVVKIDGKALDKTVVHGVSTYFITFALIFSISLLLLSIDNYDFATTFSALAACVNNVGPSMGLVGAAGNYSFFSDFSKLILCFNMLIGRLEIYPMLLLLAPHTWRKL